MNIQRLRDKLHITLVRILRRFVALIGGILLSRRNYYELLAQRARAIKELSELETAHLKPGLTGIVLSKDRALQLYALLHTYARFVKNPTALFVIYTGSNEPHKKAYIEVETAFQNSSLDITFACEKTSFRETLMDVLKKVGTKNIFFLVDDIIFIKPLNLDVASSVDPLRTILSFRHSPHLRRSYTSATSQMPPDFSPTPEGRDLLMFKWFEKGNEWSDPWSLDGQVLSTAEVRVLSRLCDFGAPNTYEAALKSFGDIVRDRNGMCYGESKILNLPINRVQNEVNNISGNVSPEFLLEQWNKGLMLDTSMFDAYAPSSTHEEHPVRFVRRGTIA